MHGWDNGDRRPETGNGRREEIESKVKKVEERKTEYGGRKRETGE